MYWWIGIYILGLMLILFGLRVRIRTGGIVIRCPNCDHPLPPKQAIRWDQNPEAYRGPSKTGFAVGGVIPKQCRCLPHPDFPEGGYRIPSNACPVAGHAPDKVAAMEAIREKIPDFRSKDEVRRMLDAVVNHGAPSHQAELDADGKIVYHGPGPYSGSPPAMAVFEGYPAPYPTGVLRSSEQFPDEGMAQPNEVWNEAVERLRKPPRRVKGCGQ